MINFNKYQKITNWKNLRKKVPIGKNVENLEILKLLDQGFYAQQINQKTLLSPKKLSIIINSFKSRKLIEQIQAYPKRYKLTKVGKLILAQGDLSQTRIQEFISDKRKTRIKLLPVRGHQNRFKNKLVQKPLWLNSIYDKGIIHGLNIKKVNMCNWEKSIIYFNYQDFNGLDNIEVCNNVIIYNFRQKLGDQLVFSKEELIQHKKKLISNCKQARSFLQEKGFIIGQEEPVRCQKPQYGISSKDPRHIGQLGKELLMIIKTDNEEIVIDDSPKQDGEEETDNEQKVISYFALPDELDKVKEDLSEINGKINEMNGKVSQILNKEDLNKLETKVSQMNDAMISMANGIQKIAETITTLTKQSEQIAKTDPGGMYQ